ncbi:hypothetical protein PGTUg99_021584 [Puccinia graminis f. sp. tritici]|uniref:Uncharacterized protein n=1 Tax=Puccinia graminis f. sp. tritici TaxID=56615 RepID=A0A5B0Q4D2_PUCGR|nr:hypothetical protein PGTUg99_021584 [Puccinia graminis f. sp. tritici]
MRCPSSLRPGVAVTTPAARVSHKLTRLDWQLITYASACLLPSTASPARSLGLEVALGGRAGRLVMESRFNGESGPKKPPFPQGAGFTASASYTASLPPGEVASHLKVKIVMFYRPRLRHTAIRCRNGPATFYIAFS